MARLEEIRRELYDLCPHPPSVYLHELESNFTNLVYQQWKAASFLTPKQHIQLDKQRSSLSKDAFLTLLQNTPPNSPNSPNSPTIKGGQKKIRRGQAGFNQHLTSKYQTVVENVRKRPFQCAKKGTKWQFQPYQMSTTFLASPKCPEVKNMLIVQATGSGKTPEIHSILSNYIKDDRVKLFLVPDAAIQANFYRALTNFDTHLAKFVKSNHGHPEQLLTFKAAAPYTIRTYKTYLNSVQGILKFSKRMVRARKIFGQKPYEPCAPVRTVLLQDLLSLFEETSMDLFLEKLKRNEPCIVPKVNPSNQKFQHKLVTLRPDYGYNAQAREVKDGMIRNPLNNRIIVLDEIHTLFYHASMTKVRMLIYMLQYAVNTIVIGLTATPLLTSDAAFSEHTCRILEMIKGRLGCDPLRATAARNLQSNEGFITYFNSLVPPLYPRIQNRVIFSVLKSTNYDRYVREVAAQSGKDPLKLLDLNYGKLAGYATSKYLDQTAKQDRIIGKLVHDFEDNANKLACLWQTLQTKQKVKTVVLFVQGLESFRAFVAKKYPQYMFNPQGKHGKHGKKFSIGFMEKHNPHTAQYLKIFNHPKNLRGQYFTVNCIDLANSVGTSFEGARRFVIVSSALTAMDDRQWRGRILRMCAFDKLPPNERTVQIDIMVSTLDPRRRTRDLTDETRFEALSHQHMASSKPVLTVDEVAYHSLQQDIATYTTKMQQIFQRHAMDNTWFTVPSVTNSSILEEKTCQADEPHHPSNFPKPNTPHKPNKLHKPHKPHKPHKRSPEFPDPLDSSPKKMYKPNKYDASSPSFFGKEPKGIGVPALESYHEHAVQYKLRPSLSDDQEIKLSRQKFRHLALASISEYEFDMYKGTMQVPNMSVTTYVYTHPKEIPDMIQEMRKRTNALVLVKDHFPKNPDFGHDEAFDIRILLAEAAKKWKALAHFYNKYFVGESMQAWTAVRGVALYYIPYKNRVYVQYEPNIRLVRPVLFVNFKAWMESLGDKSTTKLDFHRIYQQMGEWRRSKDKLRFQKYHLKRNKDGTQNIMLELRVPDLINQELYLEGLRVLESPQTFANLVQFYKLILYKFFESQGIYAKVSGKQYILFSIMNVNPNLFHEHFEEEVNHVLLNPDPKHNYPVMVKGYDGQDVPYYVKGWHGVTSQNLHEYIRYSLTGKMPSRISGVVTSGFPSTKQVLAQNNGNVRLVLTVHGYKMVNVAPLPQAPAVHAFDLPKTKHPWIQHGNRLVVTRPMASVKAFALHASEKEWTQFWTTVQHLLHESEHVKLAYTSSFPAQFHVTFGNTLPQNIETNPQQIQDPLPTQPPKVQIKEKEEKEEEKPQEEEKPPKPKEEEKVWSFTHTCPEIHRVMGLFFYIPVGQKPSLNAQIFMVKHGGKWTLPSARTMEELEQDLRARIVEGTLGLNSLKDQKLDFKSQGTCMRVQFQFTTQKWHTARAPMEVKFMSLFEFWNMAHVSQIVEQIQKLGKEVIYEYIQALDDY